jgi:hypothetical protein
MGQTTSVAEIKEPETVSNAEVLSNKAFDKLLKSRQKQLEQQLELLDKVNQDIPTSKVQIQNLIDINQQYYEPIKRPDLRNLRYQADGTLNVSGQGTLNAR